MPNSVKNEKEIQALDELMSGLQRDVIDLRKRVDAIADRCTVLDVRVGDIDATVLGMKPMLKDNTDLTEKAVKGALDNKKVLDRLEPSIDEIHKIVTERKERDAARAFVARWGRFCKSTS